MRIATIIISALFGLVFWPFLLAFHLFIDIIGYILKPYLKYVSYCIKAVEEDED